MTQTMINCFDKSAALLFSFVYSLFITYGRWAYKRVNVHSFISAVVIPLSYAYRIYYVKMLSRVRRTSIFYTV